MVVFHQLDDQLAIPLNIPSVVYTSFLSLHGLLFNLLFAINLCSTFCFLFGYLFAYMIVRREDEMNWLK